MTDKSGGDWRCAAKPQAVGGNQQSAINRQQSVILPSTPPGRWETPPLQRLAASVERRQPLQHRAIVEFVEQFAVGRKDVDRAVGAGQYPLAGSSCGSLPAMIGSIGCDGLPPAANSSTILRRPMRTRSPWPRQASSPPSRTRAAPRRREGRRWRFGRRVGPGP